MRTRVLVLAACGWLGCAAVQMQAAPKPQAPAPLLPASAPAARQTIDQFCVPCHSQRLKTGGLVLEKIDLDAIGQSPELWEKVIRKVKAGVMPPQNARRPDTAATRAMIQALESDLDQEARLSPNPGRPLLHRLNRAEYRNAIRDLLALDVDVTTL